MTKEQLAKGKLLGRIIEETKDGLEGLKGLAAEIGEAKKDNEYDDGLYNLSIRAHGDGSGAGCCFTRYMGNTYLLRTIIVHTEEQLLIHEEAFKAI